MKFFKHFRCNIPEKYQHNIQNVKEDSFHKKYKNVVLSCYFNSKQDPIHHFELKNKRQPKDNYNYIKPLYDSCKKYKLHLIIFHDCLSSEFIKKYQTDRIIFRKTNLKKNLSINDERYIIYFEYLINNPYVNILSSDVSDVFINGDVFSLINNYTQKNKEYDINDDNKLVSKIKSYTTTYFTENELKFIINGIKSESEECSNKIFIGTNSIINKYEKNQHPWFQRRKNKIRNFNKILKDFPDFKEEIFQIYNPGTIMANYKSYMCFIRNLLELLFQLAKKSENGNWNMIIASYLIKTYLFENANKNTGCTKYIYTGFPFNSIYKKYEKVGVSPSLLIHK